MPPACLSGGAPVKRRWRYKAMREDASKLSPTASFMPKQRDRGTAKTHVVSNVLDRLAWWSSSSFEEELLDVRMPSCRMWFSALIAQSCSSSLRLIASSDPRRASSWHSVSFLRRRQRRAEIRFFARRLESWSSALSTSASETGDAAPLSRKPMSSSAQEQPSASSAFAAPTAAAGSSSSTKASPTISSTSKSRSSSSPQASSANGSKALPTISSTSMSRLSSSPQASSANVSTASMISVCAQSLVQFSPSPAVE
mmetsp:Transcript_14225/g.36183  ORF Transcript_14225/g.36183 Transcript_14225/m.36183 type:complete len:255 (+) Transcript_14225:59-823(+)